MNREIEAKHTPGPWKVFNAGPHYNNQAIDNLQIQYGEDGECISDHVYTQADARLIAAAPELMEALERSDKQMEMAGECIEAGRYDEALLHVRSMTRQRRAAIAKARGELT